MSDAGHSRSPSEGSADTQSRPSLGSMPSTTRHDSRNTLQYSSAGYSAAQQPRAMHMSSTRGSPWPPTGPAPVFPGRAPGMMSSAASMRSAQYQPLPNSHARSVSMPYAGSVMSSRGFAEIPTATSDNDYLGFCKGAWKVQNGDRKGAMEKSREAQSWSRNAGKTTTLPAHLKCHQSKCAFRSNYISDDAELIWDKIITRAEKGVKVRWRFLAKSHVPQKVVIKNQFGFKCLICVYMGQGERAGIYVGTETYIDHISAEHRGQHFHDVMLYKIGCINDRVAEDDEDFDINLWPLSVHHEPQPEERYLSDALLGDPSIRPSQPRGGNSMNCNQPWVVDTVEYEDFNRRQETSYAAPYQTMNQNHLPPIPPRSNARLSPNAPTHNTANTQPPVWQNPQNLYPPSQDPQSHRPSNDGADELQLTTCLDNILQVFGDGSAIIDRLKANSAVVHLPFLDLLEQSLLEAPPEIQREWQRGVSRYGRVYEMGDYTAIIALSQMTIQLHGNVVDRLHRAIYGGEPTDLASLADSADLSRQQTIATLNEFKQRLMQAPPPQAMPNPSVPPTAAAAMQQAQQAQREAAMPRQHLMHMRPDLWKDPYMPNAGNRNNSAASSKADRNRQPSEGSDSGETKRRPSMLGAIKDKTTRKMSLSKSSNPSSQKSQRQHSSDVDELVKTVQNDLNIHPALRQRAYEPKHGALNEVAELDSTTMHGAI